MNHPTNQNRTIPFWLALAVLALFILAPRLAFAGAVGLISGRWKRWNQHMMRILESKEQRHHTP